MTSIELIRSNFDLAKEIIAIAPDEANEYSAWGEVGFYKTHGEKCDKWNPHYKWWNPVLYNSFMKQHRNLLVELKRLVESVDLIESFVTFRFKEAHNGLIMAKKALENIINNHAESKYAMNFEKPALERAIADYEAIYSNDCEVLDHPEDYTSPNCKKYEVK
ncbi:putative Ribosomal L7/L12 C-terminal domain protein [Acinetobacter proteolyticus]|uniref:Putative Ribosomal L7/L12 C-terminal domain protein n=1 Tax=Acinetobacter proteolyticus TaxID=1776741 RepID=A0A653K4W5_9GAMM|nr:hypothetical protein [Acinetobacter proteolyticus]VXA55340.1 putative Ribosomal L7/L12 C-terminal domain protein [Acinetobacter proteolyticus]